ncbi:hypothetical protein Csa_008943, partial [Cucumis sativus]
MSLEDFGIKERVKVEKAANLRDLMLFDSDHRSAAPSSTSSAAHQWTSDHLLVPISSVNSPFKLVLFTPNLLLPPPSVSPDL